MSISDVFLNFLCKIHGLLLKYHKNLMWDSIAISTISTVVYFAEKADNSYMKILMKNIDSSPLCLLMGLTSGVLSTSLLFLLTNRKRMRTTMRAAKMAIRERYAEYIILNLVRNLKVIEDKYCERKLDVVTLSEMQADIDQEIACFKVKGRKLLDGHRFRDLEELKSYFFIDETAFDLKR
jgi:hypothetical protein